MGHTMATQHHWVKSDRTTIVGQLAQGIDFQHTLDRIRDNLGKEFHQIHLLTNKNIANIERTYGLKGVQRHKDMMLQVCAFGSKK